MNTIYGHGSAHQPGEDVPPVGGTLGLTRSDSNRGSTARGKWRCLLRRSLGWYVIKEITRTHEI